MGYCIKLISKKEIQESDIKSIIFNLPDYLRGPLDEVKEQEWGWPCVCDVNKPNGKELIISGAYAISGNKAQDFTSYIQQALDRLGYDVDVAYTDTISFDEKLSRYDKKIKLNPEIKVDIPEVKLTTAKMAENLKKFNETSFESFKNAAEAMSNFGSKASDLIRNAALKDSCSHCGKDMKDASTKYCEKCYQLLIVKNAELQLKVKRRIPEEDVKLFMSKLRDLIIKPQTNKYDANDKLKDISELYLKYIDKLGGIKYESND